MYVENIYSTVQLMRLEAANQVYISRRPTYAYRIILRHFAYTECNRRNGPDFERVFLMLNYTEKPPKHLYPKLNGLGDNGQLSLKL